MASTQRTNYIADITDLADALQSRIGLDLTQASVVAGFCAAWFTDTQQIGTNNQAGRAAAATLHQPGKAATPRAKRTMTSDKTTRSSTTSMKPGSVGYTVMQAIANSPNITPENIALQTGLTTQKVGTVLGKTNSSLPNQGYVTANGQGGWTALPKAHKLIQQYADQAQGDQQQQNRRAA